MMANAEGNCEGQVTREGEVLTILPQRDEGEERK